MLSRSSLRWSVVALVGLIAVTSAYDFPFASRQGRLKFTSKDKNLDGKCLHIVQSGKMNTGRRGDLEQVEGKWELRDCKDKYNFVYTADGKLMSALHPELAKGAYKSVCLVAQGSEGINLRACNSDTSNLYGLQWSLCGRSVMSTAPTGHKSVMCIGAMGTAKSHQAGEANKAQIGPCENYEHWEVHFNWEPAQGWSGAPPKEHCDKEAPNDGVGGYFDLSWVLAGRGEHGAQMDVCARPWRPESCDMHADAESPMGIFRTYYSFKKHQLVTVNQGKIRCLHYGANSPTGANSSKQLVMKDCVESDTKWKIFWQTRDALHISGTLHINYEGNNEGSPSSAMCLGVNNNLVIPSEYGPLPEDEVHNSFEVVECQTAGVHTLLFNYHMMHQLALTVSTEEQFRVASLGPNNVLYVSHEHEPRRSKDDADDDSAEQGTDTTEADSKAKPSPMEINPADPDETSGHKKLKKLKKLDATPTTAEHDGAHALTTSAAGGEGGAASKEGARREHADAANGGADSGTDSGADGGADPALSDQRFSNENVDDMNIENLNIYQMLSFIKLASREVAHNAQRAHNDAYRAWQAANAAIAAQNGGAHIDPLPTFTVDADAETSAQSKIMNMLDNMGQGMEDMHNQLNVQSQQGLVPSGTIQAAAAAAGVNVPASTGASVPPIGVSVSSKLQTLHALLTQTMVSPYGGSAQLPLASLGPDPHMSRIHMLALLNEIIAQVEKMEKK